MNPSYRDIHEAAGREPEWYDDNGTPRFAPFDPMLLGVYDHFVILARIECQDCGKRFLVGCGWPTTRVVSWRENGKFDCRVSSVTWETIRPREFHYGDPPNHGCIGDTMNSIPLEIVEAWDETNFDWTRIAAYEGSLDCEWAS